MTNEIGAQEANGHSSFNGLLGYDMVYAITQETLNSQFAWLTLIGLIKTDIHIGQLDEDGFHFEGKMDAPQVELVGGVTGGIVRLTIRFTEGNMVWYEGFGKNQHLKEENVAGKGYYVTYAVNLAFADYNQDTAPPSVKERLGNFQSSDFDVRQLYLDFQNSEYEIFYEKDRSHVPDTFGPRVSDATMNWLKNHPTNPYVVGYVKLKKSNEASVFQPAGATYLVSKHHANEGSHQEIPALNTLCFLLETMEHLPVKKLVPGQIFNYNLVESSEFSGAAYISQALVLKNWVGQSIIPVLQEFLWNGFVFQENPWKFQGEAWHLDHTQLWTHGTVEGYEYEVTRHAYCRLVQSTAFLDGRLVPSLVATGYTAEKTSIGTEGETYLWGWSQDKIDFSIEMALLAGVDGTIQIRNHVHTGDPVHTEDSSPLMKLFDLVSQIVYGDRFTDLMSGDRVNKMKKYLEDSQTGLNEMLSNLADQVVFPAPSTFMYKDLTWTEKKDMQLHITYNSAVDEG